ncbi:NERD domain-containing protein [Paenibacillus sp. FSL R7-0198]|uniref:NERD domain-containing protein n=1 Tax=Paenibacillus sp. FSL R7-0198 TaxID=2921674 RepID=UPI0030FB898D
MACEYCSTSYSKEQIIEGSKKHLCETCSYLEDMINNFVINTHPIYVIDLTKKFLSICPIFNEGKIISANSARIDLSGYDEEKIIKKITNKLELNDTKYLDKKSIAMITNHLMGHLFDNVREIITDNPKGYLLSFLKLLEYNIHITMAAVSWLNRGEKAFKIEEITDNFSRTVVQSLDLQKKYNSSFNSIYKEWENVLALDKQAFQYGIEIINYYSERVPESNKKLNDDKFGELIATVRAIFFILNVRDIASEGLLSENQLIIDKEGLLRVNQKIDHDYFSDFYVDAMINRRKVSISNVISKQFDQVCQKYIGVDLDGVQKIGHDLLKTYKNSDEFLIGSISYFKLLFMELLNIPIEASERLLALFMNDQDTLEFAVSTTEREYRPLRKCLIPIKNDIIACPVSLLSYAATALYLDIIENSLPESSFKRELFKITSQVHKEFEKEVANSLKTTFKDALIKYNVRKENEIPFHYKKGYVTLSGQIDVLILVQGKLFVIECKDNPYKYTAKAISNELNKFRKVSKGSYQFKLKNKINDIKENWDSVISYLGVADPHSVEKHEPIGLFVVDSFSASALEEELVYPVVLFSGLRNYIYERLIT